MYKREGDDLVVDQEVPVSALVLGGETEVPTLSGNRSIKIKPGTQPGSKVRLKGHGIKRGDGEAGNLYVRLQPRIPKTVSDEDREIFLKLREKGY